MQTIRVLFLTNNSEAIDLFNWICSRGDTNCNLMHEKLSINYLTEFNPDLIVSYGYRHIIKKDIIDKYQGKIINLHISYLPWNKGSDPNIWSFIENTPKGVTIHLIDEGIDTGNILFQKEIFFDEEKETLATTYLTLQKEIKTLFINNWDKIKSLNFVPEVQKETGSIHYIRDLQKIKYLISEKRWDTPIKELINNNNKYFINENIELRFRK